MRFQVLKSFHVDGVLLDRGAEADFVPSRRTQDLVAARFLLPLDPTVEALTKTAENAGADQSVARQAKRKVN